MDCLCVKMAAAAITEIAEELQCPICFGELDRPKVLDCKHVFCCKCLIRWVEQKQQVECPVCKDTGSLRKGENIEDLPEPLILTKLQETVTRFMTASLAVTGDRTCDSCTRGKPAGYFCHNCGKNMCEQWDNKHSTNKLFKNHKVSQLSRHTVCSEHKGELKTFFCQDCEQIICNVCLEDKHETHNVVEAQEVVPVKTKEFQVFKKSTEKIRNQVVQHESMAKTNTNKTDAKYKSAERELEDIRRMVNESIDEVARKLHQKTQAEKKKQLFHIRDLEDARVTQDNLLKYIDDILTKGSDIEIVSAAADIPSMSTNVSLVVPQTETPNVRGDEVIGACQSMVQYGTTLEAGRMSVVVSSKDIAVVAGGEPTILLSELPMAGTLTNKLWERKIDSMSYDTVYDEKTGDIWISTNHGTGGLWRYDLQGKLLSKLMKGCKLTYFTLDTKRDTFIVTGTDFLTQVSKAGDVIKQVIIPEAGYLQGVTYLPDRDLYAVGDIHKHCGWFVDAERMKVVKQIGSHGSDDQFNEPLCVGYYSGAGYPCPVIVFGDTRNHCVKVLDTEGRFVRRYGSPGSGDGQLNGPAGVCVDNKGRIIVSDYGNMRVVRFWHSGDREQWEVVVTPEQLGGLYPWTVVVANRGHLAVTSVKLSDEGSEYIPPSHLSLFSCQ